MKSLQKLSLDFHNRIANDSSTMQARLEGDLPCELVSMIQLVDLAGGKSIHDEVNLIVIF